VKTLKSKERILEIEKTVKEHECEIGKLKKRLREMGCYVRE
jgi:hypothetical protein